MNTIKVNTDDGQEIELTEEETKFFKAVKRLQKLKQGRVYLFGSGFLDIRIYDGDKNFGFAGSIIHSTTIRCEGGDGGDFN